jgi:hypothetical protein
VDTFLVGEERLTERRVESLHYHSELSMTAGTHPGNACAKRGGVLCIRWKHRVRMPVADAALELLTIPPDAPGPVEARSMLLHDGRVARVAPGFGNGSSRRVGNLPDVHVAGDAPEALVDRALESVSRHEQAASRAIRKLPRDALPSVTQGTGPVRRLLPTRVFPAGGRMGRSRRRSQGQTCLQHEQSKGAHWLALSH